MDMNSKKEKLLNNEISVFDLTDEEILEMKKNVKKELVSEKEKLDKLNKRIKDMKVKIDNWAN